VSQNREEDYLTLNNINLNNLSNND